MDIIPEINCTVCNQKVPVDRDCCPYCHTQLKSYWFEEGGNIKRAVSFSQNGKSYIFIDGTKLSFDDKGKLPYAFKSMFDLNDRQPQSYYINLGKQIGTSLLKNTFLGKIISELLFGSSDDIHRLPPQWDNWLK
jgi:hypothetical protein